MYFCIRDDDTSFFTSPEELERAYSEAAQWGQISLAVVPFHRAGTSKAVPEKFRGRWTVHPLHENRELVHYLRSAVAKGRFEIMLHGYHHDEPSGEFEFAAGKHLVGRVSQGRKYLEDLLGVEVRVFVPPRNAIGRDGLRAIAREGLHLGGVAGVRTGWPLSKLKTWKLWRQLRSWRKSGRLGVPWILDLGDHREITGNAVTPVSHFKRNKAVFDLALHVDGVFCLATHYWELPVASLHKGDPTVREHLYYFMERARSDPRVVWRSVGDTLTGSEAVI
jgi:predicted deacetylase